MARKVVRKGSGKESQEGGWQDARATGYIPFWRMLWCRVRCFFCNPLPLRAFHVS